MRIDAYATEAHYMETIAPVWQALPVETRGVVWLAGNLGDTGANEGCLPYRPGHPSASSTGAAVTLIAAYKDQQVVDAAGGASIYLEHGAGQTYNGRPEVADDPSYSGSRRHDRCVLFIAPNETVAERWRKRYPGADAVAVGCPRLDWHHAHPRDFSRTVWNPQIAVSFHPDIHLCPETTSALWYFESALPALAASYHVLGHGHPRMWSRLRGVWQQVGVELVPEFDQVLRRADVLVADNTSALPEAASCGIPLVFLNSRWYDRSVHHGGRFWDWPKDQVNCDDPDRLVDAVALALKDPAKVKAARKRMVAKVYSACDGHAAERAAQAIIETVARRFPEEDIVG